MITQLVPAGDGHLDNPWHVCRHKPTVDRRHRLVLRCPSFEGRRSLADTLNRLVDGGEDHLPLVMSTDDACCVNINSSSLCGFS